jgi:ubiquinone/menaquinone biosynthesis C-methylase UbiE
VWKVLLLLLALATAVVAFLAVASGVHLTRLVGWNEAERLIEVLAIQEGMTVADVGAGDGWLAIEVARRVGPSGHVFATEIDDEQRAAIHAAATREGLDNVSVVTAGARETGLPAACCEVVYLRHVYHHVTDPAALNESLVASVSPGARLAIIDFEPRGVWRLFGAHQTGRDGHGVGRDEVIQELEAAGFRFERGEERWGRIGYLLVFRRPEPTG